MAGGIAKGLSPPGPSDGADAHRDWGCLFLRSRRGEGGAGHALCPLPWHVDSLVSFLWLHQILRAPWGEQCWVMGVLLGVRMEHHALRRWHEEQIGPWGLCCAPKTGRSQRSLGGLQPHPPFQPACSSGPEAGRGAVARQHWGTGRSRCAGVGVPIKGVASCWGLCQCSSAWQRSKRPSSLSEGVRGED